jgi:2-succinyl-6-hydroxy-2,4-cyclohexadiene-1-carboxylate synthase
VPETVVLLHGFGGTRHAWDGVAARLHPERYLPLALDLPGHGRMAAERPITFAACVAHVLASAPARFALCGYSMGGRIALHVALAAPRRVARLVLVSSTAGIADALARARRRAADEALAAELEQGSFEDFIERWRSQPLFAGESEDAGRLARADHRRNRPADLAAALRGLGPGVMEPLWDSLAKLEVGVSVVVGARDGAYQELGRRMVARLPRARLLVLAGGHGLPLENPAGVAAVVEGLDSPWARSDLATQGSQRASEGLDAEPGR